METRPKDSLTLMLTCRDARKSVAFYRDMLGFELEKAWPDEASPMWANLVLGTQSIMLGQAMAPEDAAKACGDDAAAAKSMAESAKAFREHKAGVGVVVYVRVDDVDRHHRELASRGLSGLPAPKTQFYGIRDFALDDPDGYRLLFYQTVSMASCQSCGMPMKDAPPGELYCAYCTDEKGNLRPFAQVLEGTTTGYFMAMQKMPRAEAERAARAHLATMPAWHGRV